MSLPDDHGGAQDGAPDDPVEDEHTVTTGGAQRKASEVMALESGTLLDARYQVEAPIGEGGSGMVFRAWDRVLGEPVAVKILHPARAQETSWIRRLAREVKVARAIRHPNVCRVFDLGHADGHWFVTMELAAGGNLRALLREEVAEGKEETSPRPRRPLAERLADARAICAGLAAIHAVGIIHRDVTPQNVLRMIDGRLVISDFGLAIENDANTTVHGGTPAYMPPEAAMGERSDMRSDVWQLGTILHEIVFGRRPEWLRTATGVTMKRPSSAYASRVEEELARLCEDCVAQDPALRPATAVAVAGRLAAAEIARPRTWPARLWMRSRALARRHPRARLVATLAVLVFIAARVVLLVAHPALCRGGPEKIAGIWDLRTKALVRRAFAATRKPYAADAFWNVNRAVEQYLEAWAGMYTEACEATNKRGEQSAEVLDLRMSCLQERLSGVKALSAIFANADGKVVGNAVSASGALPPLERCGDVKLLRSMVQPPEDPKLRERVAQLRQRVAQIKATRDAGRLKDATQMATALVNDARTIDYPPVQAEAQGMLGELETVAGDPKRAEALLEQAFWTAEAARDDELKAETAVYLIGLLGYRQGRYADAELWAQQSQATLRRIGGHERLQAWMQNNVAIVYHMQGRYPEALAAYQRAREVAERALPPDDPDVARPLGNLAVALMDAGRPAEALPYNQRAVDIFRKTFGAGHPEVATHLTNRGEILNALGRWREARALFTASLAVLTKELPPGDPSFGEALSGIGQSFLGESEPDKAIAPLERAVAIRDKSESEPSHVAATIFMLARALWDSGRDRPRAVTLAKSARTVYGERPLWHDNVVEIDRWVAAHRVAAVVASAPHAR